MQAHAYISYFVSLLTLGLCYHLFTKYGNDAEGETQTMREPCRKVALIKKNKPMFIIMFRGSLLSPPRLPPEAL